MSTTKEQFLNYLDEQEEMMQRLQAMVPRQREDYPMVEAEVSALQEIKEKASVMNMNEFYDWLKEEMKRLEKALAGHDEVSSFPVVGRLGMIKDCIKWLKQDHTPIVNTIYLP